MNIFMSWSGEKSKLAALALRDWLPCIFQSVKPWMSTRDIRIGVRWSHELAEALQSVDFGIVCVTEENRLSPWVHFESGALSKALDRGRVVPYLIDVPTRLLDGPLSHFQAISADEYGTKCLIDAIAEANPNNQQDQRTVDKVFKKWWPELKREFARIDSAFPVPKVRRPDIRIFTSSDVTILELLAHGIPFAEMAEQVGCTRTTLRVRIQQVILKLNATDRDEAIELAREFDLIPKNVA